jgi:Macrocin-O-methyltransferase (TylF)
MPTEDRLFRRLYRFISSPKKWRRALSVRTRAGRRALSVRIRTFPFRFGITSVWPGTYLGYLPDRYWDNYDKYTEGGGVMRRRDICYFVKGNKVNNCGDLTRYYFINLIIAQIMKEKLKGDIAELGVYKGNTAYFFAKLARALGGTVYLLDTYEGFSPVDFKGIDAHQRIQFADTSLTSVQGLVGNGNVRFIKGYFPESIAQMPDDLRFSLVHIDCDLHEPFRAALLYFYPRLKRGGFLILHDYSSFYCEGAERAIDDFFLDKPEKVVPIPDKSGTVVIRKV